MSDARGAHNPDVHHEGSDVNIRAIFNFALGLLVVGLAVHVAVWLLFLYFSSREAARVPPTFPLAAGQQRLPPEPRLQSNPREDLRELRRQEDEILTSYGWVDKGAGVVRIPVSEAMKLTVQRGLPVRQERKP